ncbi:MAG: ribbon-helix-helix domain-containing protein [Nitrospirota bacterium]
MEAARKRVTVYFNSEMHKVLRLKAVETETSVSDLVNEAVQISLLEDAADMGAIKERALEPNLSFDQVVKDMKRRGRI